MTATNGNPPTDEPMTAEVCLAEAIANLRQAEQAWPDSRVSDAAVRNVVEISRGWVMAAAEARAIHTSHFWDDKPKPAPRPDIDALEFPKGTYAITAAQLDDLGLYVDESGDFRPINDKPSTVRWAAGTRRVGDGYDHIRRAGASVVDEKNTAAFRSHRFRSISGTCRDCDATPEEALAGRVCTATKAHEHGPNCRHAWVHATAPCSNGCDAMPEDYYIGMSPTEVCPKSSCPDVNA